LPKLNIPGLILPFFKLQNSRSDSFWERYIEWELERKNLKNVTSIYKKVAGEMCLK